MKYIITLIVAAAVFAAVWFGVGKSVVSQNDDEVALREEASRLGIPDGAKNQWIAENKSAALKLEEISYEGLEKELEKTKAAAKNKFPKDYNERYDFVVAQMIALNSIKQKLSFNEIGDAEYAMIESLSLESSDDYARCAEYANVLAAYFADVRKMSSKLPRPLFDKEYALFVRDFKTNPAAITKRTIDNIITAANFHNSEDIIKMSGLKEYLEENCESAAEKFDFFKRALKHDISWIFADMRNASMPKQKWDAIDESGLNKNIKNALYFADVNGKTIPVFYIKYLSKTMFVANSDILAAGTSGIEIKRGEEVLKCNLWKYSSSANAVILVPDKVPTATPIVCDSAGVVLKRPRIMGINCFGRFVCDEIFPMAVEVEQVKLYDSDYPSVFADGTLIFDDESKVFVAMKCCAADFSDNLPSSIDKEYMAKLESAYPKRATGLVENLKDCKFDNDDVKKSRPMFVRFSFLDSATIIDFERDKATCAAIETLSKHNRLMIDALARNEYSYLTSDAFAAQYPEISKIALRYQKVFLSSGRLMRSAFTNAYARYLSEINRELQSEKKEIQAMRTSEIRSRALERELAVRDAICKIFTYYTSGKCSLEKAMHADLLENLSGSYYFVKDGDSKK